MGHGEKISPRSFHLHRHLLQHHHQHGEKNNNNNNNKEFKDVIPKGFMAIKVGQGEEQQRFVVPVIYFNHPLFMQLLKEAEEEYGFDQKGTITIPCHVEEFRNIRGLIDREKSFHHHHHHHHHVGCFGF
ncbi:Auxin-responsive protein saur32 [Stylosanthes scabra]|uniref:Auxin-responsive protein saur32 n=1 Tax=Stylosanthes scabra TaxID=79078 RepID=A0ABU6RAP8_9FABA|nr:Auxin-responsive protein saur32 [Stylosanthes scabra]